MTARMITEASLVPGVRSPGRREAWGTCLFPSWQVGVHLIVIILVNIINTVTVIFIVPNRPYNPQRPNYVCIFYADKNMSISRAYGVLKEDEGLR